MGELQKEIQYLKGVGPNRAKCLKRLEIQTIEDLLYHFPRSYQDRTQRKKINELVTGETATILAKIVAKQENKSRRGMNISKLVLSDDFSLAHITWFNQSYLLKNYQIGMKVLVTGRVERKMGETQLLNAEIEVIDGREEEAAKIIPIYPSTENLSQKVWRSIMRNALDYTQPFLVDVLPEEIRLKFRLPSLKEALNNIHFPPTMELKEKARKRLAFEEFFLFQLALALRRKGNLKVKKGIQHQVEGELLNKLLAALPFQLTDAQSRVIEEIKKDLRKPKPMTRLVQGDVGAGKTIVAALALTCVIQGGYQGALMAPTEILAEQHFNNLSRLLSPLGIRSVLLTGSLTKKQKGDVLERIRRHEIDLVIGTHALIQDEVSFAKLGLAVTDEQHRFGVLQRASLQEKGLNPDSLVMTATPIPRTLSLTLYGDLDVSIIDQLPPGRQPIRTQWASSSARGSVYNFLRQKIQEGRQVYIVCPLVEESEKLDLQAATELANNLQEKIFPNLKIGLLHGKMKTKEKDQIMEQFRQGTLNILVSTTVIEVGVDVPNATVMVVENSERFGLAQLHQLRGRVGRGKHQSFCILITDSQSAEGKKRVNIMIRTNNGFEIAEEDLKIRGPGEFLGLKQHGFPTFKIANLVSDLKILEAARQEAFGLLAKEATLSKYPLLAITLTNKFENFRAIIN